MQITIKVLNGKDCSLEVVPATTVLEMKKRIEAKLKIPIGSQKLVVLGRTLADEKTISCYPLKEGSKVFLVVMKTENLRDVMYRAFRKYYTEQQSERLTNEFMNDFELTLKEFSLDDLERFSDNILNKLPP